MKLGSVPMYLQRNIAINRFRYTYKHIVTVEQPENILRENTKISS